MLEKILIFILFLGPLVFFHELGHFLFARLFGVRVEVFSLGFGPKLLKFKRGDTEYTVSLIPLGGYVKMFGDDPLNKDAVAPEDRPYTFNHKGKWARFWIVMGGPLANFLMAYVLFFFLLLGGEKVPEIRVGAVPETSVLYDMGFRVGDSLRKLNDKEILSPTDIALEGNTRIETMDVERNGELLTLNVGMSGDAFFEEFVNYPPILRKPYVLNKDGERFVLGANSELDLSRSLDEIALARGELSIQIYSLPKVYEEENLTLDQVEMVESFQVSMEKTDDLFQQLYNLGFAPVDLSVKSLQQGGAGDKAGLLMNDIIVALNGSPVFSFEHLRSSLQETTTEEVELTLWREGEESQLSMAPQVTEYEGEQLRLIGVYSNAEFIPLKFIQTESKGLVGSLGLAVSRTWDVTVKTIEGFKKLFMGQVSLKTIGGPIAIGKVATDSFNTSLSYFFQLMALISINLGIINLLPIPVLDGGHILFIFLEIFNRGPLSRKKMEIAQQVGLSFLLVLMVGAIFNDIMRFF